MELTAIQTAPQNQWLVALAELNEMDMLIDDFLDMQLEKEREELEEVEQ